MELKDRINEYLHAGDTPVSPDELAVELGAHPDDIDDALEELRQQGVIMYTRKGKAALPQWLGCVTGRLQGHQKGFAFLLPLDKEQDDIYIPSYALGGGLHEDIVAARVTAHAQRGQITRREGEVIEIIRRARETIVCSFQKASAAGLAVPEDSRISQPILIPAGSEMGAHSGELVVVEITRWPDDMRIAEGRVTEVLGESGAADIKAIIRHYALPDEFDQASAEQATGIAQQVSKKDLAKREDFRDIACVTIDGEDAKDFDDAISLRKDGDIYELGVHIADVSHYVRPGSPIDRSAYERGTSTYFPDMVLPMLPFELSNGICSLRQDEDRLVLSCIIRLRQDGSTEGYRFCKGVIKVKRRLTYTACNAMLNNDAATIREYDDIYPLVRDMNELAEILTGKRQARGSIDFDLPESHIVLDEEGRPVDIYPYERGASNVMIEEFMLTANECAAHFAQTHDLPFVYRIHEDPNEERIDELYALLETLGIEHKKPVGNVKPKQLQRLLAQVEGQPYAGVVNRVMLRCQKKAKYSERNSGHFGLALRNYCHYTSPIRRYPDLIVHRMISAQLEGGLEAKAMESKRGYVKEAAEHCSERERVSMEAERAVDDLKKAEYMKDRVGEQYTGIISGVTDFGIFVELPTTVEGLVRLTSLEDDYYIYDEKQYRIIGQRGGRIYSMGDEMEIIVAAVDLAARKIEFHPAGVPAARPQHKRRTRKPNGSTVNTTKKTTPWQQDNASNEYKSKQGKKPGNKGGNGNKTNGKRSGRRRKSAV